MSNEAPEEPNIDLIGFIIASDADEPNFYILFVCNDDDRPIGLNGEILFFRKPELAPSVLEISDDRHKDKLSGKISHEIEMICDISFMTYLIEFENEDLNADILNCLNIFFDFIKFTGLIFPRKYQENLYKFADYLTFDQEYATFFQQESIERSSILEAIYWCLGAILSKSKIIQE